MFLSYSAIGAAFGIGQFCRAIMGQKNFSINQ